MSIELTRARARLVEKAADGFLSGEANAVSTTLLNSARRGMRLSAPEIQTLKAESGRVAERMCQIRDYFGKLGKTGKTLALRDDEYAGFLNGVLKPGKTLPGAEVFIYPFSIHLVAPPSSWERIGLHLDPSKFSGAHLRKPQDFFRESLFKALPVGVISIRVAKGRIKPGPDAFMSFFDDIAIEQHENFHAIAELLGIEPKAEDGVDPRSRALSYMRREVPPRIYSGEQVGTELRYSFRDIYRASPGWKALQSLQRFKKMASIGAPSVISEPALESSSQRLRSIAGTKAGTRLEALHENLLHALRHEQGTLNHTAFAQYAAFAKQLRAQQAKHLDRVAKEVTADGEKAIALASQCLQTKKLSQTEIALHFAAHPLPRVITDFQELLASRGRKKS